MCSYVCYSKMMFSMFLIQEIRKGLYHITPLGEAVLGRNVDVSIVLMENGADVQFKSGVSSCDKCNSLMFLFLTTFSHLNFHCGMLHSFVQPITMGYRLQQLLQT